MSKQQKPKFKRVLVISISLFVLLPLICGAAYFIFSAYEQSIKQAKRVVSWQAQTEVIDISNKLSELTYRLVGLANDRVLGEVAVNILYSQFATNKLQEIVESNANIKGAFIADASEFVVEGHPLSVLTIDTMAIAEHTNALMNASSDKLNIAYLTLDSQQLYRINPQSSSWPTLLFAVPLKKEQRSLISPFKTTAVLYIVVDAKELFKRADEKNEQIPQQKDVFINGQLVYSLKTASFDSAIVGDAKANTSLVADNEPITIEVKVSHDQAYHLENIKQSIVLTTVFITIVLVAVILLLVNYAKLITSPLLKVRDLSKRFASGDYSPSNHQVHFFEFAELVDNMNSMANTISQQLVVLEKEKQRAESSERVKAEFLANMSHEIRTPLNGVIGLIDMAYQMDDQEEINKLLNNAHNSAKLLLTIVNDILDFSKLEQGKVKIECIPFSVKELSQVIYQTVRSNALLKGIEFDLNNKLSKDRWQGDPTRVSQILFNLVSNALKFTEKGTVKVEISQTSEDVIFKVIDTGIGIAKDKLPTLFDSFKQADLSTTRKFGGTGLGLTISKMLAELMGGEITVTSALGEGSTFILRLPLKPAREHASSKPQPNISFDGKGLKVLIAEDNKVNQTILMHLMKPTGCELILVDDGLQAFEKAQELEPDIILMDVQMPVMDGLNATIKLREAGFRGPIIMQTANVLEEEVKLYQSSGATAHIAKPIVAKELYQQLYQVWQTELSK